MSSAVQILDHNGKPMVQRDTAYDAASHNSKETHDWWPTLGSADADLLNELETISARSHDLTRNNGLAHGYSQTLVDNVIGPELRLAAKPNYAALGKDKDWAEAFAHDVESRWRTYASSTDCDVARKLNFGSMTQLVMRTAITNGEALGLPIWTQGRRYNTAMMLIDPIRLSNPYYTFDTDTLRGGIKTNKYGEALGYHIQKSHPFDVGGWQYDVGWDYIPARTRRGRRRVIHVYDQQRTGQSRGIPMLASVMGDFKMAGSYQKVELRTAIANSLIAAFIESTMAVDDIADAFDANYDDYIQERKGWKSKLTGGDMIQLPPGDKVTPFTPNRPGNAFGAFMESAYRNISAGLNVPYELLMKDFSKTNYSSARAAMLEAWRFFMNRRHWVASYWAQPVYELWFEEAVLRGEIDAPDFYENKAAYCGAKWIGPGRGWVDVVKEAKGAELRMDIGLSTQQDECGEQGKDYEDVQDQRASELKRAFKIAKEKGLPAEAAYRIAGFRTTSNQAIPDEAYFIPDPDDNPGQSGSHANQQDA